MSKELDERHIYLYKIFYNTVYGEPDEIYETNEAIFFLVSPRILGRVIGKGGANVKKLVERLKKQVYIYANSDDPLRFLQNFFNNIRIINTDIQEIMGEKILTVFIDFRDKAKALGKNKARLKAAKHFFREKFGINLHLKAIKGLS